MLSRLNPSLPYLVILMVLKITLLCHSPIVMATPKLSGFINAIGGYATERPTLGYEADNLTFTHDSLLGLQISSPLTEKISATGQVVARGSESYTAEAAWAYLTLDLSDSTKFRMGRFRTPFFLYSDFLDVGYAQHWIRPPEEVYALQFDSIDGMDISYNTSFGRMDSQLQMYFGSADDKFMLSKQDAELDVRLREQMGVVGTLNYQWFTARASFHQVTRLTIENFQALTLPQPFGDIEGLAQSIIALDRQYDFGRNADFVLEHLDVKEVAAEFSEFAVKLHWPGFFIIGEGTLLIFDDSLLAKQRRHLASVGTHFGDTTLYATYARANDEPVDLASAIPNNPGVTDGVRRTLAGLTSAVSLESETTTLGVRYDLNPGAAFKLEISENTIPQHNQSNLMRFGFHLVF